MVQLTGASKNPAAKEKIARKQNEFFNFAMAPGLFATVLKRVDGSYSMPFVSEGVRELYGLDPEDVMRDIKLFTALVHPDDIAMIFRKADESARDLTPYSVEYRINHPDKGMRWIENSSMPQRLPDGGTRWDGFFHDITGRKRLEQELKLKELVIEHAHDALYLMDQENFVYANEAACRSLGYSRDELLALTLKDIDPDFSAAEEKQAALNKLLEEGSIIHETRHYRRDGSSFPVEIQASLFDYQGKSLVLSVARDITERKRMEQALIDSEQKFRSLAENVPDNIARWDTETRYIYVNSVCERTLDSPAAKVIGKTIKEAFPDGRFAQIATGIAQIVATGKTITVVRQPAQFANGERQLHDVKMVPERDAAGKIIGVLGIGRDMTGFYRLQDELEAKEKELRVLAESTPGMMGSFYARPDGSICMPYVSPNIEKLFGLRPQDMAVDASALLALNHPEDAERVRESIAESARTMTTWHEEYRILHPMLGERWIESNTMPQQHPDGGIVWYGYVHDITERKRLENEMIASDAQLSDVGDRLLSGCDFATFDLSGLAKAGPL